MTSPTPTGEPSGISAAACIYLFTAGIAATCLIGIIYAQTVTHLDPYRGVVGALAAALAIAGCGYIIRSAEDRVMRRLDRMEAAQDEQHEAGYAEGYVAAAAGGKSHLAVVNHR